MILDSAFHTYRYLTACQHSTILSSELHKTSIGIATLAFFTLCCPAGPKISGDMNFNLKSFTLTVGNLPHP